MIRSGCFSVLLSAIAVSLVADDAADREARIAWLNQHAIALRSIDPADEDFADLEPLRKAIGEARIVQLGEQSHGDGAAFHAKARLIKFLHQKMGFDVLAFESGLYDCRKAWEALQRGDKPLESFQQGVFGIWTGSEEVQPLIEYVGKEAKGRHPLELCGFDCQFTAAASKNHLGRDIEQVFNELPMQSFTAESRGDVLQSLADILQAQQNPPTLAEMAAKSSKHKPSQEVADAQRRAITAFADALAAAKASDALPATEIAFWKQYAKSLVPEAENHWSGRIEPAEGMQRRDRQMADNLVWLARERYPNRKIVVWAASFHVMRNPSSIKSAGGIFSVDLYRDNVTMGHEAWKEMGTQSYTLGFVAAEGTFGRYVTPPAPVREVERDSLEELLVAAGQQNAIVDFRQLDKSGDWLRGRLVAHPLGYRSMTADWTNVFDGLVFTRTMSPSTPAKHLGARLGAAAVQRPVAAGGGLPGWFFPPVAAGYELTRDTDQKHGGKQSARLKPINDEPRGFGNLMQAFAADDFRGKRVRMSAFVKVENVERTAGLWMRVDGLEKSTIAFDNMSTRPIKGTSDWQEYEIVLDIAQEAADISFGVMLPGKGQLWVDDFKFEVVGNDVATTALPVKPQARKGQPSPNLPKDPKNLDFEA